ncbi:MAG TPA: transglutaminaseTgpA domain-containing protein [Terriglobales bacterium]|nr:transglutaminaseTgpA domain-containing protein [Terriglobales bacterium]
MAQARFTGGGLAGTRSTVERYFEIALYLMIVTGFTTLAGTGKLDLLSVLVVLVALGLRGYLLLRERTVVIPESWTSYIAIFYALFYVVDFLLLSGSFVTATAHLVLLILVVKLFSVHRNRDIVWLCVLAFLSVLAAAVLTVDTLFLAAFALFLLLAVATFTSWEMARSAAAAAGRAREAAGGKRRMAWSLSTTAAMLMVSILLGAAGIFFVLPRVTGGYLSQYAPRNQLVSGFSDDVRLGEIGEIQQSSQVIMRIEIEGDTAGSYDLMWRGVALASFDGRRWFNPPHQLTLWMAQQGRYDLEAAARATQSETATQGAAPTLIHYRVVMEPVDTNVFFLAPVARELTGSYRQIALDKAGTVYNQDRFRPVTYYAATSDITRPRATTLRAAEGTPSREVLEPYLQLPALDPRIRDLARQITSGAGNNYDRAAQIENYLKTRFGYTLQLSGTKEGDPLAHFLFERRQGHCEYFASAMTVMLRALGVPARIVNGFRGGEFNDVTGSYIVRARDAHSWVEAYFPGQGWVAFDPTPAADRPQPGAWQRFLLYVDAAREFWREWVINYDFTHQNQLGSTMLEASRRRRLDTLKWIRERYRMLVRAARETQQRAKESPQEWGVGAVATLASLMVLLNSRRLWRGWRNRRTAARPERAPRAAASIWYERLLKRLARRGWPKRPSQTPEEFLATLGDAHLRQQVAQFTGHYERARFGESAEDAKKLPELYEEITASR